MDVNLRGDYNNSHLTHRWNIERGTREKSSILHVHRCHFLYRKLFFFCFTHEKKPNGLICNLFFAFFLFQIETVWSRKKKKNLFADADLCWLWSQSWLCTWTLRKMQKQLFIIIVLSGDWKKFLIFFLSLFNLIKNANFETAL